MKSEVMEKKNEIVVYQPDETTRLEVRLEDETVWLNQLQMADLFGVKLNTINYHIKEILKSGELTAGATIRKIRIVRKEGSREVTRPVDFNNLDMIISVGYRVNSARGIQFRQWATQVLKAYLLKGYAVNARINQLEDKMDRRLAKHEKEIVELRERVDFVVQSALPAPEMVFCEGEFLTAHDAIRKIVRAAKRRLILIDNYIDERVLTLLAERRPGVACHVYGKNAARRDVQLAYERFRQQYPNDPLALTQCGDIHDRFIVCDDTVWLCGSSVKDAGRKMFALVRMTTKPDFILSRL